MKYIIGRNNFALTIFIPQDCNNNCPICTSKENYEKQPASLQAVIESIHALSKYNIKFHDLVRFIQLILVNMVRSYLKHLATYFVMIYYLQLRQMQQILF